MKILPLRSLFVMTISMLLLLVLAYLDYISNDLSFFVFYFIPIFITAWFIGKPASITLSTLAAIAWLIVDRYSAHPYSNWSYPYWNALVRWTSFMILALSISQIKSMLEKEKRLKHDLTLALDNINKSISVARKVAEGDLSMSSFSWLGKEKKQPIDEILYYMVKRLSEQKSLEKRLFQLERQAIMAETASHLAHEIRNPLNLIMLTTHHIGNQFLPAEESKQGKFNDLILSLKSEVEHLSNVISNFMTIGKSSEIKKVHIPVSDIIDQVQILIRQQLLSRNIRMECKIENNLRIFADPEQIKLVFLNLFVNAIAAVPDNGRILLSAQSDSQNKITRLTVCDNGIGINPEDFEQVFEPYFTRKEDGTGLGLALVKRIIDDHNGSISASNSEDGGARFEIVLPSEEFVCQSKY